MLKVFSLPATSIISIYIDFIYSETSHTLRWIVPSPLYELWTLLQTQPPVPQRNPLCRAQGYNPQNRPRKGLWLCVCRWGFMVTLLLCHCTRASHTGYNLGTTKHCKLSKLLVAEMDSQSSCWGGAGGEQLGGWLATAQGQPAQMGNSAWSWVRRKVKMLTFFFHFFWVEAWIILSAFSYCCLPEFLKFEFSLSPFSLARQWVNSCHDSFLSEIFCGVFSPRQKCLEKLAGLYNHGLVCHSKCVILLRKP